jgi:hypothetical protein
VSKQEFWSNRSSKFRGIFEVSKVMDCYDFLLCCEALNEENFKPNFVLFGVKLKEL